MSGGQRKTCRSFCVSNVWVPGIGLRASGFLLSRLISLVRDAYGCSLIFETYSPEWPQTHYIAEGDFSVFILFLRFLTYHHTQIFFFN